MGAMLTENNRGCYLKVFVKASSKQNKIVTVHGEELKINIAAPSVDGKANRELVKYLSRLLKIGRDKISITRGNSSRHKTIFVSGLRAADLEAELIPDI